MARLVVKSCGALTTLQDAGRIGYQRYGLSSAGAMDRPALAIANALVGNAPSAAAIELALLGAELQAEGGDIRVALAGADCKLSIDGEVMPELTSCTVRDGQRLQIDPARSGLFAYLAVAGGIALPPQLGSLSVHIRAGLGGIGGRPLRAGDALPIKADAASGLERTLPRLPPQPTGPLRVVLGPQDDLFTDEGKRTFLASAYRITSDADRMGYRLTGPKVAHANGYNIVSDGIVAGSIQVPGSGEPIVMLADRQTTGGYPKIATLASVDIARLAQSRPGTIVRFTAIDRATAVTLLRQQARELAAALSSIRPAGAALLDSESLLAANLAGDAVDAQG
jgi:biotin-dependent carboxylase-like uncharacterized protein